MTSKRDTASISEVDMGLSQGISSAVGGVREPIDPRLSATLARFARDVLATLWEGCHLDGGEIQDLAEKHGLIREVSFHPARHTDHLGVGAQAGDPWWVEEKWLRKLANADTTPAEELPGGHQDKADQ